jgi:predicted enzyme related to lactoylglutathione lyase
MINGMHALIYSKKADAVRAFVRDVLGLDHVDAGRGWLIFAAPPTEIAVHPGDDASCELYLMCDDIETTKRDLEKKGVKFSRPVSDQGWGLVSAIELPDGEPLGIYQPKHPVAYKPARS